MENKDQLLEYSIPQLLRWRVESTGDKVALREKDFGCWTSYTWDQYYDYVRKVGLGLQKIGLQKGDIIARITTDVQEIEISIMNYLEMIVRDPPSSMFLAAPKKRLGLCRALASTPPESTLPDAGEMVLYALANRVMESSRITTS